MNGEVKYHNLPEGTKDMPYWKSKARHAGRRAVIKSLVACIDELFCGSTGTR